MIMPIGELMIIWCNDYAYWWIDDESCCCCWIFV